MKTPFEPPKINEGMSIYAVPLSGRTGIDRTPKEYIVTRVGRKYFYACPKTMYKDGEDNHYYAIKIGIEYWQDYSADYNSSYQFYPSIQAISDGERAEAIQRKLYQALYGCNRYPLNKLEKAAEILGVTCD
jgi:hypothetical protein